jgi:hypothetical protein
VAGEDLHVEGDRSQDPLEEGSGAAPSQESPQSQILEMRDPPLDQRAASPVGGLFPGVAIRPAAACLEPETEGAPGFSAQSRPTTSTAPSRRRSRPIEEETLLRQVDRDSPSKRRLTSEVSERPLHEVRSALPHKRESRCGEAI